MHESCVREVEDVIRKREIWVKGDVKTASGKIRGESEKEEELVSRWKS